jgi:hypothetical protein
MSPVNLSDYVDVKERIRLFYERFPDGRLCTGEIKVTSEPDGVSRVWAQAFAYRDPTDIHPGTGWSWLVLPGSTNFTRGSEIENAETSAWGRAIGALGIGIAGSIASKDEIDAKVGEATRKPEKPPEPVMVPLGEQTFTGRVARGDSDHNDLAFHDDPNGSTFGFKLVIGDGQSIPQVLCTGALGAAIAKSGVSMLGQTVTVTGEAFRVEQVGRRPYRRLIVETIEGEGFKFPTAAYVLAEKVDDLDQLPF